MKTYLFIGMGGFLGAISRFIIEHTTIYHYTENIPLNTLIINVSGSFILVMFLTIAMEILTIDTTIRLAIATGFLGAYTTFSTLCKEIFLLLNSGYYFSAVSYLTISTVLGLSAAYFASVLAKEVVCKIVNGQPIHLFKQDDDSVDEPDIKAEPQTSRGNQEDA